MSMRHQWWYAGLFEPPYVWVVAMSFRISAQEPLFEPPYVWVVAMSLMSGDPDYREFEPPYVWVVAMSVWRLPLDNAQV